MKRRLSFPGTQAICLRCGAPASTVVRGGQLVPVKGLRRRRTGGARPHVFHQWQHADPRFCDIRLPHKRRTPTSRQSNQP